MKLREIAKRIPDNVRSQRLLTEADPINNANEYSGNEHMQLLFTVWGEFVEPNKKNDKSFNYGCPYCRKRVLSNFKAMYNDLVELENEYLLLKSLKK